MIKNGTALAAVLLDVHGTALQPRTPVERTYLEMGRPYGVTEVGFAAALARVGERLRMTGDGRPFWRAVVAEATGSADPDYFEALYAHFAAPGAWTVAPGFHACCERLRAAGVRVAFLSNADARLRPLLAALGLLAEVDDAVISAEVEVEKPAARFFHLACGRLGVSPGRTVHVGDSLRDDVVGARQAGLVAWRWGVDVRTMAEVAERVLRSRSALP